MKKTLFTAPVLAAVMAAFPFAAHAAPQYLDLKAAANSAIEDDGVADNGKGGWSDEGANDMFIFPKVQFGEISRNGYKFKIVDPAENSGKSIIMLKGAKRCAAMPQSVEIPVPDIKAKYVYVLLNAVGQVKGEPKDYAVAKMDVSYADGSSESLPLRDGLEIRQWWTSAWWDNSGAQSWPFIVGRNHYSMKWNQFIGLWATQWRNPHPEKPVAKIKFSSEGKAAPAFWAVTLDDDDYFNSPSIKADFKRPEDPPPGFFDAKAAVERNLIYADMKSLGMAKGLRSAEVMRPDLVALTFDSAVSKGPGLNDAEAAALQKPERFSISEGQGAPFHPLKVGRHSFNYDTVQVKSFPNNNLYWHCYYLQLPEPMKPGSKYLFKAEGLEEGLVSQAELAFDDKERVVPAIKVNQGAYSSQSSRKFAYLGFWAGDMGPIDYQEFKKFEVVDEATGKTALSGEIKLRRAAADDTATKKDGPELKVSGESVYEMDLSPLTAKGRYHVRIPGLGRSYSFSVGADGLKEVFRTAMRGFLMQRCGCEVDAKHSDWPRPACHLKNYESGHLVYGVNEKYVDGKPVVQNKPEGPDDPVREFRGGYHDAGDYDVFYEHMLASSKIMNAFEFRPEIFKDGDLNIPESGNGVPDVLDEVAWNLKFYAENQQPDGGIFAGRGNDEDYSYKEWKQEFPKWKELNPEWRKYGELPPYQNFFPCNASSNIFAAVAAQFSRALKASDPAKAKEFLDKARKAYDWALAHQAEGYEREGISYGKVEWRRAWLLAASELFKTTGEQRYNDDVKKLAADPETLKGHWSKAYLTPFIQWPYASCKAPGTDEAIRKKFQDSIVKSAESVLKSLDRRAYRMGSGKDSGGWGSLVGGGQYGNLCLMAFMLTGDRKFIDGASLNADYQLGANPLSRSFITGVGSRPPEHPELRHWLYNEKGPAHGISVFGPGGGPKSLKDSSPQDVPLWRCWIDNRVSAIHNEFGLDPLGSSAMLYGILWALEGK